VAMIAGQTGMHSAPYGTEVPKNAKS